MNALSCSQHKIQKARACTRWRDTHTDPTHTHTHTHLDFPAQLLLLFAHVSNIAGHRSGAFITSGPHGRPPHADPIESNTAAAPQSLMVAKKCTCVCVWLCSVCVCVRCPGVNTCVDCPSSPNRCRGHRGELCCDKKSGHAGRPTGSCGCSGHVVCVPECRCLTKKTMFGSGPFRCTKNVFGI
jgi:hypothetical protein